jgi:hypothetical protein
VFLLQSFIIITLIFFVSTYNVITLWYLGGLYLILFGLFLLLEDGDIFIGFLWVIDLGVGLVFFIFILHFSSFLNQKANISKSSREFFFLFTSFFFITFFLFFFLSWYDYYDFFFAQVVTDLNLLREIYFVNNSWEFFIINLVLFYAIITSILLTFFIKRVFNFLNWEQYLGLNFTRKLDTSFFIRNQDFLKQQYAPNGTRVWVKKKNFL